MSQYRGWSHDDLVKRVMDLESQLRSQTEVVKDRSYTANETIISTFSPKKRKAKKSIDPSRYSTHHVALKLAYLGANYNGFEHHANNTTALPTIEEELWRAMMKACLIFPSESKDGDSTTESQADWDRERWEREVTWAGCDYSKCGRTDRGVSAFGQVIGIRMRSNRPLPKRNLTAETSGIRENGHINGDEETVSEAEEVAESFDPIRDELNYPAILNRILPPDIRIIAWCPVPSPDFSARFSCRERRYRYFFTQPAFLPCPSSQSQSSFLDIDAMRQAASHLVGTNDFRNFCKVDASKQITNFIRRITHASIEEVSSPDMPSYFAGPEFIRNREQHLKVYALHLHGSAFLWHQVRCIMAILFFVGQRLEKPSVIQGMLDMSENGAGRGGKPRYEMADELPLVLWDCVFPDLSESDVPLDLTQGHLQDAIPWIYVGEQGVFGNGSVDAASFDAQWGRNGIMDSLWRQWRERKMHELLAAALMDHASRSGRQEAEEQRNGNDVPDQSSRAGKPSTLIYDGGSGSRAVGKYLPLLQRERMEPVEVINERYAKRKGLGTPEVVEAGNSEDADE
ncbi:pseudouridylate synthase-like protein 3 [Rhizodiscina lignyota]|uniref:Pseudouridylate synthase-like protein 3 n=1 Tax=Rhizodiscina lignyota TaxID=1504668 RepID=A0A9P4I695_9PEZI|nr:pseudouridylate synthase-like protein 3 [Rhizodiscina lignyota]